MKYLTIALLFISTNLLGQVKLKELQGYWICTNQDSAYFKKDTVILKQVWDSEKYQTEIDRDKYCSFYNIFIDKGKFQIDERLMCKEPPYSKSSLGLDFNIFLFKSNNLNLLVFEKQSYGQAEVFKILDYSKIIKKGNVFEKQLVLKRLYTEQRIIIR